NERRDVIRDQADHFTKCVQSPAAANVHYGHHKIADESEENREANPGEEEQGKAKNNERRHCLVACSLTEKTKRNKNDKRGQSEHGNGSKHHRQAKQKIAVSLFPISY